MTFVNKYDKSMRLKINLFKPYKNKVKVVNILVGFNLLMAVIEDDNIFDIDDDGLSIGTFEARVTYLITRVSSLSTVADPQTELSSKLLLPKKNQQQCKGHSLVY